MRYLILLFVIVLMGCFEYRRTKSEYKRNKNVCLKVCKKQQLHNVGAKFMWSDFDMTFGKCTCVSKFGDVKTIFIESEK